MKFKKHGMKHEGAEGKPKEKSEHKNPAYGRMEKFEKAMHGKNRGKGFKGYKGGM